MNEQTRRSEQGRCCLVCGVSLNTGTRLRGTEGFKFVRIQTYRLELITGLVASLNDLLNRLQCTICVQADASVEDLYWLSFRFIEIDRVVISNILYSTSEHPGAFDVWMRYIAAELLIRDPN